MIFVNFKNYPTGRGESGQQLIKLCRELAAYSSIPIYPIIDYRWANGLLLNHSSHPISHSDIKEAITTAVDQQTLVCCSTLAEGLKLAQLQPTYLAYEPPELIGGHISVSTARPEIITNLINQVRLPVLVGAGIRTTADVSCARRLGAVGVLVSSVVMTTSQPRQVLLNLIQGFYDQT